MQDVCIHLNVSVRYIEGIQYNAKDMLEVLELASLIELPPALKS